MGLLDKMTDILIHSQVMLQLQPAAVLEELIYSMGRTVRQSQIVI